MADIDISMTDVMRSMELRVSVPRSFGWRVAVAGMILRLAGWVLQCDCEVSYAPRDAER